MSVTTCKSKDFSIKAKTVFSVVALVSAVLFPQLTHTLGAALNLDTSLGEMLLPMHFPVMLLGLLVGPVAAGITGLVAPVISFALTAMPKAAMLPFIAIELCVYGLSLGLLRKTDMPTVFKVLITTVVGRAVRAAAILISVYGFNNTAVNPKIILSSITLGAAGIVLQLIFLPVLVKVINGVSNGKRS